MLNGASSLVGGRNVLIICAWAKRQPTQRPKCLNMISGPHILCHFSLIPRRAMQHIQHIITAAFISIVCLCERSRFSEYYVSCIRSERSRHIRQHSVRRHKETNIKPPVNAAFFTQVFIIASSF